MTSALIKPGVNPVLQILTGTHKGKQFRLLSSSITIGRSSDCDVIFKDNPSCSKHHARITKQKGSYLIESLNSSNPVLVNKKPVESKVLKAKDKILIGNIELMFLNKSPVLKPNNLKPAPPIKAKKLITPPRVILALVLVGVVFLLTTEDETKTTDKKLGLKTETEMLKEVEDLENLKDKELKKHTLSEREKSARIAFIKGFRDYRKGYFNRALNMFQHCLTLNKSHPLCQSYVGKSKTHIDKLIQKKIRLGNAYKKNKQFEACQAVFKSVEIMIKDSNSLVYKEVVANKKLCAIQLKNKI